MFYDPTLAATRSRRGFIDRRTRHYSKRDALPCQHNCRAYASPCGPRGSIPGMVAGDKLTVRASECLHLPGGRIAPSLDKAVEIHIIALRVVGARRQPAQRVSRRALRWYTTASPTSPLPRSASRSSEKRPIDHPWAMLSGNIQEQTRHRAAFQPGGLQASRRPCFKQNSSI